MAQWSTKYISALENEGYPDSELCPHNDCAHNLALPFAGWYICGSCGREFWCRVWEGDNGEYFCYLPEDRGHGRRPEKPEFIPVARDLGSSWGTPPGERDYGTVVNEVCK